MGFYESAKQETRKKIVSSFWERYKKSGIEKITVRDITDASGIYRTTFYLHFPDVYAILEMLENHFMEELQRLGRDAEQATGREAYLEKMNTLLERDDEYLRVLVGQQKSPGFAGRYKEELVRQLCGSYGICLENLEGRAGLVIQHTLSSILELLFGSADFGPFTFREIIKIIDGYMNFGVLQILRGEIGSR